MNGTVIASFYCVASPVLAIPVKLQIPIVSLSKTKVEGRAHNAENLSLK